MYDENWAQICESLIDITVDDFSNCPTEPCETVPPVFVNVAPNVQVDCNEAEDLYLSIIATDNCDKAVTITYEEEKFRGNCNQNYLLSRTYTATDDCGNTATALQTITVTDKRKPVFNRVLPDTTIACNRLGTIRLSASDNCDTYVSVNQYDTYINDTQKGDCIAQIQRIWVASDDCGNRDTQRQIITVLDTLAPRLSGIPDDVTVWYDNVAPRYDYAYDECANHATVSTFEYKIDSIDERNYTLLRGWLATDKCGNASEPDSQFIKVVDETTFGCNQIIMEEDADFFSIKNIYSYQSLVSFIREDGNVKNTCQSCRRFYKNHYQDIYYFDVQLIDQRGNVICERRFDSPTRPDNPCNTTNCETESPVLANVPADITVECDAIPNIPTNITATDNCDSDLTMIFEELRTNGDCFDSYTLTRTWTAKDVCGNTASSTQQIVVTDNTAPILSNIPADQTINENDVVPIDNPTATDNCDTNIDITIEDAIDENTNTIVRTFTATDNCGNTATAQQVFTIIKATTNPCSDIIISTNNDEIRLGNITASNSIIKVFDPNWQIIYECTATCESELVVPVVGEGIYHTDVQFYDENWGFICADKQDVEIIGGGEPCDTSICAGDVILRTQAEVDNFCGCEVIESLTIDNFLFGSISDISSIENLAGLRLVKKNLIIKDAKIRYFTGLENLVKVGGTFSLRNCDLVENLKGLDNLKEIGRDMILNLNGGLFNLKGLNQLSSVGNELILRDNPNLTNIGALTSLEFINGIILQGVPIQDLTALSNIKNSALLELTVTECDKLVSFDGLEFIRTVKNGIGFGKNALLEDISALRNVINPGGDLTNYSLFIFDNPVLSDCCSIAHLIDDNPSNGITEFGVTIENNTQFCNSPEEILQNCQNQPTTPCETTQVTSKGDTLNITNLSAPTEILKVFDTNYNIIYQCFADCEESLSIPDLAAGTYHININFYNENWQPICEKNETVEIAANAQNRNSDLLPADFALFPNPAEAETYIDLSKLMGETVALELFNQFGQRVQQQVIEKVTMQKIKIDLGVIQNGLYILKIEGTNRKAIAKKLIVNRLY